MRKYLVLLIVPFFLFSCGEPADVKKLKQENDSLQNLATQKENKINEFIQAFNEIQSNLDEIKQKEQILTLQTNNDKALDDNAKEKINDDILSIYELMIKNKKAIAGLSWQLKQSNLKIAGFEQTIVRLTNQIEQQKAEMDKMKATLAKKDIDIANLNEKIIEMDKKISDANTDNENKQQVINAQDEALNTAYYVYGTSKELKANKIIENDGLFKKKVGTDLSKDYFTKIDIRKNTTIELNHKKAKILSNHPSSSYYLETKDKMIKALVIKDPQKFWENSKFLVIMVD